MPRLRRTPITQEPWSYKAAIFNVGSESCGRAGVRCLRRSGVAMNRRALLQGLLGGAALAAAPTTALALPREARIAAAGPAIARVYCRFGQVTELQHAAAAALRQWEAELGRKATAADVRYVSGGNGPRERFYAAHYRSVVESVTAVRQVLESRGWVPLRPPGEDAESAMRPNLQAHDPAEKLASFSYESHWLHPAYAGTVQDVLLPLYGVAGMASARVSLGRMGWSEGEF